MPVGPSLLGRIVDPLGRPLDERAACREQGLRAHRAPRAGDHRPRFRQRAGLYGLAGHRFDVRPRARPARTDHRRSGDRQDRDRRRLHHQPEEQRHHLRLRRDRPEVVDGQARHRSHQDARRARTLHLRRRQCVGRPGPAMARALFRLHHGGILSRPRPARAGRHRRHDQARRHPPRDRAAHAPAAGPRGLSGRCVLCARAAARARGQAVEAGRRRLADRAADRRIGCRQPERLHPDQPDLDHRRPDRPRLRGCSTKATSRRSTSAPASAASAARRRRRRCARWPRPCGSTMRSSWSSKCSPASAA